MPVHNRKETQARGGTRWEPDERVDNKLKRSLAKGRPCAAAECHERVLQERLVARRNKHQSSGPT
jgi:hypothetical protein